MDTLKIKAITRAGAVSVSMNGPDDSGSLVVLAHGAGGDMNSDFMSALSRGLGVAGILVARFNFVYSEMGKKAPDRNDALEETYRTVVGDLVERWPEKKLFLGGKSMGGRIASQIVAGGTGCDGLVFLGYPLHPPGRPEKLRDEHLSRVPAPMLFVEGSRDPFCPLDTLERVLKERRVEADVAVIDDGDHSFKVRKSSGRSTAQAWAEVVGVVAAWIGKRT